MAIITPNFNFGGQCEEALNLYIKVFNAKLGCLLRYSDADKEDMDQSKLTEEQKRYVYHSEIYIGGQRIMMSDNISLPYKTGLALSLVVTLDTKEEVLAAYEIMREGGEIVRPVRSTTYSSCEVVLVDKFGIRWNIMTEQTER